MGGDGHEVLVVDGDERVQRGLAQLLSDNGLHPTVIAEPARARDLAQEKYFAVAIVDLDTPRPDAGLELVRWLKQFAPTTTILVMLSRKAFESAVEAFRAGAADVIYKSPDQVQYLKQRAVETAEGARRSVADDRLMQETLSLHEEFLRRLMTEARRSAELEDRMGGGRYPSADGDCSVLVVEPDGWMAEQLDSALRVKGGFHVVAAASGGEAIDRASGGQFPIALVSNTLPDLTGSMVVSTLKSQSPDTLTVLFSRPGARPGKAEVIEGTKTILLFAELTDARQMVDRMPELRDASLRTTRERRYLATFRQENWELLRRFADLKQRMQRSK
jgi:DNA-binding NtrC family response regulator